MKGVTAYQLEVLQRVVGGNPDGDGLIDFDQLLDRLSWMPSKPSAQFTIRALATKGLLEKGPLTMRRGRHRVTYQATLEGRKVLDPRETEVSTDSLKGLESLPPVILEAVEEPKLEV